MIPSTLKFIGKSYTYKFKMSNDEWEIIKEGTWLYAGEVTCRIFILKHGWKYGSGDYEDPEEIREDFEGEFYCVEYCSAPKPKEHKTRFGGFTSLEEALELARIGTHNTVVWKEEE